MKEFEIAKIRTFSEMAKYFSGETYLHYTLNFFQLVKKYQFLIFFNKRAASYQTDALHNAAPGYGFIRQEGFHPLLSTLYPRHIHFSIPTLFFKQKAGTQNSRSSFPLVAWCCLH